MILTLMPSGDAPAVRRAYLLELVQALSDCCCKEVQMVQSLPKPITLKVTKNILHCLNHGTQMGWLLDPDEQTVFVYLPKQQPEVFDQSAQKLPVPSFANGLNLSVGSVFGWLLE
jgi:hypothetical protein